MLQNSLIEIQQFFFSSLFPWFCNLLDSRFLKKLILFLGVFVASIFVAFVEGWSVLAFLTLAFLLSLWDSNLAIFYELYFYISRLMSFISVL